MWESFGRLHPIGRGHLTCDSTSAGMKHFNSPGTLNVAHSGLSLALIGNASAHNPGARWKLRAEAFSMRRLEGSRWRLRRTLAMGSECHFCVERTGFDPPINDERSDAVSRSDPFRMKNSSNSMSKIFRKGFPQSWDTRMRWRAWSTSTLRRW